MSRLFQHAPLASADLPPEPPSSAVTQAFHETWFIIAAALALGLLFLLWARFLRKPDESGLRRRRVEGARHGQRPTNPTLAETGGLPPVRDSEPPPNPPPAR
ncbi:MAG: hypothetical protein FJ386_09745 [Verrucomicrobia bacterium]|nr:hypothetical protein [Verrucomicrobiota bacterium]